MNSVIRLVQKNKQGKIKYLLYRLTGKSLIKEWGILGGKKQTKPHEYKGINIGKSNELSPEEAAIADMKRTYLKKIKEGYVMVGDFNDLPELPNETNEIDIDNISKSFCCSKPIRTITEEGIDKVIASGNAKFFVKYNGGCHYIQVDAKERVFIYTRRWDDHTAKYPHIVKAVKKLFLYPQTILIAELCIDPLINLDHMWAQKRFGEISKTDTLNGELKDSQEASLALQKKYPVKAAIFGMLYTHGNKLWHKPHKDTLVRLQLCVPTLGAGEAIFRPQEAMINSGADAIGLAKKHKKKIEGFVLWDTSKAMEVTMNGKPRRRASWKIKAEGEMDVIAYGGKEGKAKGQYGSIYICQYNEQGERVELGTVAGLKPEERETDPTWWNFPCVIEVTYTNRFPDTGLLQFGSFSKVHEDKLPSEVDLFKLP